MAYNVRRHFSERACADGTSWYRCHEMLGVRSLMRRMLTAKLQKPHQCSSRFTGVLSRHVVNIESLLAQQKA